MTEARTTPDQEIIRIAHGLIDCTLPRSDWTHRGHFAAALWLGAHPEVLAREGGMAALIRRYNVATGVANTDTDGYHETITRASMAGAAAMLADNPGRPLGAVLDSLMEGPLGNKHWPFAYWTEARLMSLLARREWVEPDLAPLPWPLFDADGAAA